MARKIVRDCRSWHHGTHPPDLLVPELRSLPEGGPRVRAWLLLSEGGVVSSRSYYDKAPYFDKALSECGSDASLRAEVLARRALSTAAEGVERVAEAEAWASQALQDAAGAGPEVERLALRALGWARCLRGRPVDELCERFRAASTATSSLIDSPEVLTGLRSVWRGEAERARVILSAFMSVADERGEGVGYAWLRLNMCELELRAARWEAASKLLDEWAESEDELSLVTPTYQRCRALPAAGRGDAGTAGRWAEPAFGDAQARGYRWQVLEASRALGLAALLAHQPSEAVERVGARRPGPAGELTPTEHRVAELAAEGRSNKEIARALHVTVSTVEAHLSRAYAKLGVRSRSQLTGRLPDRAGGEPDGLPDQAGGT